MPQTEFERITYGTMLHHSNPLPIDPDKKQALLDMITPKIIKYFGPDDILKHTETVYNETADAYVNTAHNQGIIDELITFIYMIPNQSDVLDVGCGPGRDSLFMHLNEPNDARKKAMCRVTDNVRTDEKYLVPTKTFRVTGIDSSINMIEQAQTAAKQRGLLQKDRPNFEWVDFLSYSKITSKKFGGIWSCAAMFTHTPKEHLDQSIDFVAKHLKTGGIFFTSYTARNAEESYDKLLLSSTGRIKYFSHQDPDNIITRAKSRGLILKSQSFDDIVIPNRPVRRNGFANQFFVKE